MTKSPLEQVAEVRNWPNDKHWPDDVVKPLADTIETLTAERDALRKSSREAVQEMHDLATANAKRADAAEAERDALRAQATAAVAAYDRANPMRNAAWHGEDCDCLRCEMDRLRPADNSTSRDETAV